MKPHYQDDAVTLHAGDCLDVLRELPDASVHAVVTDPPAGIGFMGREWDHHRGGRDQWVAWLSEVMAEALRVTKPGGHALVWALPRTSHWTATALEDAGWGVRDCITHLFGSGFPKSLDVSKAIDRAAGAERDEGAREWSGGQRSSGILGTNHGTQTRTIFDAPATPEAERWQGWGTSLKPASEHWWLARKPLAGTVAATVLEFGTGALNIDASRVGTDGGARHDGNGTRTESQPGAIGAYQSSPLVPGMGRWPPNVVLDGAAADELDQQSGTSVSAASVRKRAGTSAGNGETLNRYAINEDNLGGFNDSGGASRFFPTFRYEPKAGSTERPRDGETAHPTVKPLALMQWLVKLVTPPGGTVLEPFAGSGTTAEACVIEGFKCIAIERDETYLPLIVARLTKPIQVGLDFGEHA